MTQQSRNQRYCWIGLFACSLGWSAAASPPRPPLPELPPTGPYLAHPQPNSITVCWVTAKEESGEVRYRADEAPRSRRGFVRVREKQPTRVHRVTLTGLQPYTRYTYTVQAAGRRSDGNFRTAP